MFDEHLNGLIWICVCGLALMAALSLLTDCAAPRVLVKDCKNVSANYLNCEKVEDL